MDRSNSRASSSKLVEKANAADAQKKKIDDSQDVQEREIKELLGNLDDESVEGRLKLTDSLSSSRAASVCSNKTTATQKSQSTIASKQKSIQTKTSTMTKSTKASKASKSSVSSESQVKKEAQEIFNNLDDEIEDGILKDPSRYKQKSSSNHTSEKDEVRSEKRSSQRSSQRNSQRNQSNKSFKVERNTEYTDEQQKRDIKEIFANLSEEPEEGRIKLTKGKKSQSESISESESVQEEDQRNDSKVSINSPKARGITENSEEQIKKEVKELLDNLSNELVEGVLRLPDGKHPISSSTVSESEVSKRDERSVKSVSKKSKISKISRGSSKLSENSTEKEIRDALDISEEPEIGILQAPL